MNMTKALAVMATAVVLATPALAEADTKLMDPLIPLLAHEPRPDTSSGVTITVTITITVER